MATRNLAADKRNFSDTLKEARIGHREAQYEVALMYANGIGIAQDFTQAIHWIREAAQKGLPSAQYFLATRYANGIHVPRDDFQAFQWLFKAIEQGHTKAMFLLGKLLAEPHQESAMALIAKAAEQGQADAQFLLATELSNPTSVLHDKAAARYWLEQAAQQGMPAAQCALGSLYGSGADFDSQVDDALYWYRKAARQGFAEAQVAMSRIDALGRGRGGSLRRNSGQERRRKSPPWEKAAEAGDANAKFHLALMYEMGLGITQDVDRAKFWYGVAANLGHAKAQLALARMLEEVQAEVALHWLRNAASQGEVEAQCALARIYADGTSPLHDIWQSTNWYQKAAETGDANAFLSLSQLFKNQSDELAAYCLRQAAEKGLVDAQFLLGNLYASGKGGQTDMKLAFNWYERAAKNGHVQAQCELGLLYLDGRATAKDVPRGCEWLEKAAAQGDAKAQWNFALKLIDGDVANGIKKNLKLAFLNCQKSAQSGFAPAQATLGVLFTRMGKAEDAAYWWGLAAASGDAESQYNLALAHSKGIGTARSASLAFGWFARAAEQGLPQAQSKLGVLYATGEGVPRDLVEAQKWFLVAGERHDTSAQVNAALAKTELSEAQVAEALRRAGCWKNKLEERKR